MCIHCGCGLPAERHGNADSITIGDVNKAMKVSAHDKGTVATASEMKRMVKRHATLKKRK
jgi:hypothetical protein